MADVDVRYRLACSPEYNVVRAVSVNDAALPSDEAAGLNCADYDEISVIASLLGGATAAEIELFFWSDGKYKSPTENGGFVPDDTPNTISLSGANSGKRKVVRVAHHGSVFLEVTGIVGGSGERVRVEVAGVPVYGQKGI